MARRGAICIGVHFSGRPQTSDASEFLVDDIAHVLEKTGCIARVYVVPFGDYQREISVSAPPSLRIILYRRLMFKVAEALASKEHAGALVTGESLGQVASQARLRTFARPTLLLTCPCSGRSSDRISSRSSIRRSSWAPFDISSQDAPDCCTLFMPRSPETHADLAVVEEAEAAFPIDRWVTGWWRPPKFTTTHALLTRRNTPFGSRWGAVAAPQVGSRCAVLLYRHDRLRFIP